MAYDPLGDLLCLLSRGPQRECTISARRDKASATPFNTDRVLTPCPPEDYAEGPTRKCPMKLLLATVLVLLPITAQAEYLGDLSANELNPNSIFNDVSAYGSLSPTSPRNSVGVYGSPVSPYSATNPLAVDAPRLYDQDGNYRGKLSTNPLDPESVSNPLGRYGSQLSPDSLNNPL